MKLLYLLGWFRHVCCLATRIFSPFMRLIARTLVFSSSLVNFGIMQFTVELHFDTTISSWFISHFGLTDKNVLSKSSDNQISFDQRIEKVLCHLFLWFYSNLKCIYITTIKPEYNNGSNLNNAISELVWVFLCLFGLYGLSTFVGYLMPNPFYTNKQLYFKLFSFA